MQLVILGYHRSGTSAATQHLARAGLFVGDDLLGANASNPHGHFEDRAVVAIHEAIFHENGQHWLSPNPLVPIISPMVRAKAVDYVATRSAWHDVWGFKDPRACLFVDFWRTVLPKPRFLICLRHYRACIDSVVRRALVAVRSTALQADAQDQMRLSVDHDAIARSWVCHMMPLLSLMRRHPELVHTVDVSNLDGSIAGDLNRRFGLPLADIPLSDTFDPELYHSSADAHVILSRETEALAERVWLALLETRARAVKLDVAA
ncbi:hypothetical protein RDV64_19150 [Acuticoccus sp. MNP-M23]|uniref:hypothetical protein n=1 Tax=Acuticoccus sp. MNP-M23 TaxID=3072793 RepID=UPI002815B7B1|nr:hypothetical protein [Acuticoccus sp. MNP-M23]WMS42162.1 hypothetical protein RDV64_19150 [Acuticoccus sp. MNP-M23]